MLSPIHISEASLIAVHAMVVAARKKNQPASTKEIALLIQSSGNHISKVMQRLVRGGMLNSTRGPGGGFTLKKKPREISLLDILRAVEGDESPGGCPFRRKQCVFDGCVFGDFIKDTEKAFRKFMSKKTLADLLEE